MVEWQQTAEAEAFIEACYVRQTSKRIMQAIAAFASNLEEAEDIWENGISHWDEASKLDFVAAVVGDDQFWEPGDYWLSWAGSHWAKML